MLRADSVLVRGGGVILNRRLGIRLQVGLLGHWPRPSVLRMMRRMRTRFSQAESNALAHVHEKMLCASILSASGAAPWVFVSPFMSLSSAMAAIVMGAFDAYASNAHAHRAP